MIKKSYLPINEPLVIEASKFLFRDYYSQGLPDASHVCCLVPTQHSGRRLREALAIQASQEGIAVSPPSIMTPDGLVKQLLNEQFDLAGDGESLWAMAKAIEKLPLDHSRSLFPGKLAEPDFSWSLNMAQSIQDMRRSLTDNGWTIQSLYMDSEVPLIEPERWKSLSYLEKSYINGLSKIGKQDFYHVLSLFYLQTSHIQIQWDRIVLVGISFLSPIHRNIISGLSESVPCESWVYSLPDWENDFDDFGCPINDKWIKRPLVDPKVFQINRSLDIGGQLNEVENWIANRPQNPESIALGVLDSDLVTPITSGFKKQGIQTYNPAGDRLVSGEVFHLLFHFSQLLQQPTFKKIIELARIVDVARVWFPAFEQKVLLQCLDRLRMDHIVTEIHDLSFWIGRINLRDVVAQENELKLRESLEEFVARILSWVDAVKKGSGVRVFASFINEIYADKECDLRKFEGRFFQSCLNQVMEVIEQLDSIHSLKSTHGLDLMRTLLSQQTIALDRFGGEMDLLGWLELLWEPAPHMAIVGFQDHTLPETVSGDLFLPEKFRVELGLPSNMDRMARDTYIIHCLAESRSGEGSLHAFFCDQDEAGNPLRPSRLSFLCPDIDLPDRVRSLMGERSSQSTTVAPIFQNTWKLKIPDPSAEQTPSINRMSVTAFSAYLRCPSRFYLQHVLGMAPVERNKLEMDPREYGSLFHQVVEDYGNDEEIRSVQDPSKIYAYFTDSLQRHIHGRYGAKLPAALWMQFESLSQRLHAVAQIEAQNRAEGWDIIENEIRLHKFYPIKLGVPWMIQNMELAGTIDRVERNNKTGHIRLVDFKTSNTAKEVIKAHTERWRETNDWHLSRPSWQKFHGMVRAGEKYKEAQLLWTNLQLPLYAAAWRELYQYDGVPEVAYFNVPKFVSQTSLCSWHFFDESILNAALECAKGVIQQVQNNIFYPANPLPDYEDFPDFFIQETSKIWEIDWAPPVAIRKVVDDGE